MRNTRPITVTLGEQQRFVDERLESGAYSSASEILRAGLRALDREEAALDEIIRRKVEEAIADPRPSIPAEDVFARLEARFAANEKPRS
jgi:antitoxin ParD1/3/4